MSSTSSPRFVKIKRPASEACDPPVSLKKFKFVGSSDADDIVTLKQLIVEKRPALAQFDEDLLITDLDEFVSERSDLLIPKNSEVITVNGVPFIQAPSNIGLDDEDRESSVKYVYDVYWYDEDDQEKGDVLVDEEYREVRDDDYSSNDEQNPDNEYPASDSDNEYSAYADYDETHEMIREFESHRLRDSDSDEEWAALDD